MPRPLFDEKFTAERIQERWGILDWEHSFPWWRRPTKVRILMYGDGPVHFSGGGFNGLQYVNQLLTSRAYYYVDFDVQFAHRTGDDPTATIPGVQTLVDLDIVDNFDQVWFFGFNSSTAGPTGLSAAELTLLDQFMSAPKHGGILVTGDHADLGRSLAGQITRAGQMRQYPAPPNLSPSWNTTLEDGPDAGITYDFNDQSDDTPQSIRYKRYPLAGWLTAFTRHSRPHPVLCSKDGPINVFPDHQHEGEALAPVPPPGDPDWPTVNGHQERPEVIVWGKIKDPAATKAGQEIGIVSAYDGHTVDVGRIIADATWHHWFDINLTGISAEQPYAGFDATPAGQAALKKIDAYFLNVAVWLSPPQLLDAMRMVGWWAVVWDNAVLELSVDMPVWYLGEQAINVLGRRTPACTVSNWVLDPEIFKEKIPKWEWPMVLDEFRLIDIPLEQFVAGGMIRRLMLEVGHGHEGQSFPREAPDDERLRRALAAGAEEGFDELVQHLADEGQRAVRLAKSRFGVRELAEAAR